MESTTDWIWAVDMLGSKIFTFDPKSGPAAQAGAPNTSTPMTTATVRSARRELIRIPPIVDAVRPDLIGSALKVRGEREAEPLGVERDRRVLVCDRHHHPSDLRDPWHAVSFRAVEAFDGRLRRTHRCVKRELVGIRSRMRT